MSVRHWITRQFQELSLTGIVARETARTVAWLEAAWRTLPVFAAIVLASELGGIDVNQFALAIIWPTLTVALLAVTDQTDGSDSTTTNAGRPAE